MFMVLSFVSGCVTTQHPNQTLGTVHQQNLVIGGKGESIPLPNGDWKLIDYKVKIYNNGTSFGLGYLIQEVDGVATGVVEFDISLDTIAGGYALSEACGNPSFVHRVTKANYEGREQDCWWIDNEGTKRISGFPDIKEQAWKYIVSNKVKMPTEMIFVKYRRATKTRLFAVHYGFNPESEGISPAKHFDSYHSEWSKKNLHRDSAKYDYVQKLKLWGATFDPKVTAGFNHRTQ